MKTDNQYKSPDGHLTDEAIALWVDALNEGNPDSVPDRIKEHLEDCSFCKEIAVELSGTMRILNLPDDASFNNLPARRSVIKPSLLKRKRFIQLAAMIVLLIGIGGVISVTLMSRHGRQDNLFAQNFIPYPDLITIKGGQAQKDTRGQLQRLAFQYYNSGNYDSAGIVFSHLYLDDNTNDTVSFYMANAILSTQKSADQAIKILKGLSEGEGVFSEPAGWYLALAFIKQNNLEIAREQLMILISRPNTYQERARVLLEQIEK